jgi:hypothetical protein
MRARQSHKPKGARVVTLTGLCVLAVVGVAVMVTILARMMPMFAPSVGQIAEFSPQRLVSGIPPSTVQVARTNNWGEPTGTARCVLATEVMGNSGGSLIIEAQRGGSDRSYVVHWAGGMTSRGASDCGNDVAIVLNKQDLIELVGSMGGFGLRPAGQ